MTVSGAPYPPLPDLELPAGDRLYRYRDRIPVFYGHYRRHGDPTYWRDWTAYTACVDFSAVKEGTLTAYRWSREPQMSAENFVRA